MILSTDYHRHHKESLCTRYVRGPIKLRQSDIYLEIDLVINSTQTL